MASVVATALEMLSGVIKHLWISRIPTTVPSKTTASKLLVDKMAFIANGHNLETDKMLEVSAISGPRAAIIAKRPVV